MTTTGVITVADSHFTASDSGTSLISSLGEAAGSVMKFAGLSVAAAANELSNIPASIGNLFGGNYEITSMRDRLVSYDSDLLKYYDDHQSGVDVAGFLGAQFIPGLGATKVLNSGIAALRLADEAGRLGKASSTALGLLAPSREKYLSLAVKELGTTNKLLNENAIRAVGAGFLEQGLQAFAWETAVASTMQSSPILDQMTASDLAANVAIGTITGSFIGGALTGAGTMYRLGKEVSNINKELRPFTMAATPAEFTSFSPAEQIISYRKAIDSLRETPMLDPTHVLYERAKTLAGDTENKLWERIHGQVNALTSNDGAASLALMDQLKVATTDDTLRAVLYAKNVARVDARTPTETILGKINTKIKELGGLLSDNVPEQLAKDWGKYQTTYIRVHGGEDGLGAVLADRPAILSVTDKFNSISMKADGVYDGGRRIFSHSINPDYSVLTKSHLDVESRYFWAEALPKWDSSFTKVIGAEDIPLLEKALRDLDQVTVRTGENITTLTGKEEIAAFVIHQKRALANDLLASTADYADTVADKVASFGLIKDPKVLERIKSRAKSMTPEEAAKLVNVKQGWLDGSRDIKMGWNGRLVDRSEYIAKTDSAVKDPLLLPKHIKIVSDITPLKDINGHEVDAITHLAAKEELYRQGAQKVVAGNLGITDIASEFPKISKTQLFTSAVEGQRAISSANANYGTLGSYAQLIGSKTHKFISDMKARTGEVLTPVMSRLANDLDGAIEFSVLNEKARVSPYRYVFDKAGSRLVADVDKEALAKMIAEGDEFAYLEIKNANALEAISAHMNLNSARQTGLSAIDTAAGISSRRNPNHFYPIPRNPKDTPYFAYVVDDSIEGAGHGQMLYAATAENLEALKIEALNQNHKLKVLTKDESAEYFRLHGQYDFEKTMNDKLIDVTKTRKGTSASLMPRTDPSQIVKEAMEWHYARDTAYVRANVSHLYQPEFDALRAAGSAATQAGRSRFGYVNALAAAENSVSNPYNDIIRMSLDISKSEPTWSNLNTTVDGIVSSAFKKVADTLKPAKSDADFRAVNEALKKAGSALFIDSDALYRAMNETVPRGALSTFVNKANALISTFALRWDWLNALNNTVGSSVLMAPEIRSVIKGIESGNAEAVGELAKLAKIKVPGTDNFILSPEKLIAKAISDFHSDKAGREWFRKNGFISTISDQYDQSLDIMAAAMGTGKIDDALGKLRKLGNFGEKWTGNAIAEEFNRYVAASVMKQITDLGIKHGVIEGADALAYINTFVNRTQGNYLASQRPMIFQGPIGQAIGLFQTYQFNLIQQLLRHVGEGDAKSAVLMMGLQSGIYGAQGLPAFNAINTHLIGNAPGNITHQDIYKTVYETTGPDAAEWLMFGGLSGITRTNMYTRGDVNPRHLFVVPTSATDVPIYQATEKVLGNLFSTATSMAKGAPVGETLLRGLEHNGVSRPLTGLAQVLGGMKNGQVIATNRQDNILMSHDLASWASLTRLAGGKPMDEAIVQDELFLINAYRAADNAKKEKLGQAIKTTVLAGQVPTEEQLTGFQESYLRAGGKTTEFNQFMLRQYKNASITQADQLRMKLANPYSQRLQIMMNNGESNGN